MGTSSGSRESAWDNNIATLSRDWFGAHCACASNGARTLAALPAATRSDRVGREARPFCIAPALEASTAPAPSPSSSVILTMLDQSFPGEGNSSSHEIGGERLTLAVGA